MPTDPDPAAWASQPTDAEKLAAWTRLGADAFGTAYTLSHGAGAANDWRTLATREPEPGVSPRYGVILAACREAEAKEFIDALAQNVARLEADAGRRPDEVGALLTVVGSKGIMQAMTDPARALVDGSVLPALVEALNSCACIMRDGQVRGTGFLVGADLVLTAAHVVLSHAKDEHGVERWGRTLWPDLSFSFRPAPGDPRSARVEVPAAADEPVVAEPYGTPPDELEVSLEGQMPAERLDYALIRLSRQISHVVPMNIREPTPVNDNVDRLCFVMGFVGGTKIMFDADTISRFDEPSGRVFHSANAVRGMSGGCCVGVAGTVIALHEGAVPTFDERGLKRVDAKGEPILDNRAVALSMVRARQRLGGRDPLDARPRSPGVVLTDPAVVSELMRTGLRLAGPIFAPMWEQTAAAIKVKMTYEPGDEIPVLHPWFRRAQFEGWVDRATAQDGDRVCFVTGARGAGKSFCATILAAKLPDPTLDLVRLSPTQTGAWSWPDAISPFIGPTVVDGRMTAGAIRYDDVPAILARLEPRGGRARMRTTPLFVAIDFGDTEGFRSADAAFSAFIQGLAAERWARLVLIGLSADERDALTDLLAAHDVTPTEIEMIHAGEEDLKKFVMALAASRSKPVTAAEARAEVKTVWLPGNLSSHQPDLQTAEAALCAIALAEEEAA